MALTTVGPTVTRADATTPAPGGYFIAASGRLLDTRSATSVGGYTTAMPGGTARDIQATGSAGIPASDVSAIVVNLTALAPTNAGYVDAGAAGTSLGSPLSFLNYSAGDNTTNSATIAVSPAGKFQLRASTTVDMIVDVQGYFTSGSSAAGSYVPIAPTRIADSRIGQGFSSRFTSGSTKMLAVAGVGGVGADASAAMVNVSVINPSGASSLAVYASDQAIGTPRFLYDASSVTSIGMIVPLAGLAASNAGKASFKTISADADLTIDVVGYFKPGALTGGYMDARVRALDTRSPSNTIGANSVRDLQIAGAGTLPATGITAVVAHVTVISQSAGSYIKAWGYGAAEPSTSVLNFPANSTVSNMATVSLGSNGKIKLKNMSSAPIDVIVDVEGYFGDIPPDSNFTQDGWTFNTTWEVEGNGNERRLVSHMSGEASEPVDAQNRSTEDELCTPGYTVTEADMDRYLTSSEPEVVGTGAYDDCSGNSATSANRGSRRASVPKKICPKMAKTSTDYYTAKACIYFKKEGNVAGTSDGIYVGVYGQVSVTPTDDDYGLNGIYMHNWFRGDDIVAWDPSEVVPYEQCDQITLEASAVVVSASKTWTVCDDEAGVYGYSDNGSGAMWHYTLGAKTTHQTRSAKYIWIYDKRGPEGRFADLDIAVVPSSFCYPFC